MAEINRLNNVNPAAAINQHDKLLENKMKRMVLKERQLENQIAENSDNSKADETVFNEIAGFFAKESGNGLLHQTRTTVPPSFLELSVFSDNRLAADVQAASYLAGEEIESFLEYIDVDGKKKAKFEELSDKLIAARESEEETLIDNGARQLCKGNKAEIYLMLCYLLEDLIRKKAKDKLQDRLKKIIDAFERQESAYLFNFFSFQSILKTSPNTSINADVLDKMANVSSGNIKLNSLRQSLQFIAQTLPDKEMYKMVSVFMKFQAKCLKRISTLNEGREGKEELANILQQERNLIILNSIYNQCRRIFFHLKKVTPIEEKYADFMGQVITVIESSVISLETLQNMERLVGVKQITLEVNRVFIKNFLVLLNKMPQQIYYSESLREKLLESVKHIIRNIDKLLEPAPSGLSFLRRKSYKGSGA